MKKVFLFITVFLFLSYSILFVFSNNYIQYLTYEDGIFENLGALWFLFAALILFVLYYKDRLGHSFFGRKKERNIFYLLLGLLLFIAFGEEISWGQRIFNFETGERMKELNAQGELNIHNLYIFHGFDEEGNAKTGIQHWLSASKVFNLFWMIYCVLFSFVSRFSVKFESFLKWAGIPIVPISISILFMINYIFSKAAAFLTEINSNPEIEIKESNVGFLYFILAISFFLSYKKSINYSKL